MQKILLYASSFLICYSGHAQVDISLNLEQGRTYYLSTYKKNTIIESEGETEARTVSTEKGSYSFTMLKELDSLYLMEVEFIHLSMKVETPGNTIFYSSDIDNLSDITSTMLRRLMKKPFRVLMRKDYTWKEVQGLDSIFMNSYNDYDISEEVRQQVDNNVRESMKEYLKQDVALTTVMYGSKKLKGGEVWTSTYMTEHIVPTMDSCSYYLAETTGDLVIVNGTGTVSSLEDEKTKDGVTISYQLKGATNVNVKFFKNSFWINDAVLKTEIKGNAKIGDGSASEKQIVPIRIMTEASITGY